MNNADKKKIKEMLSKAIENYHFFKDREDYPEKPCVRREVLARQGAVFNLADWLYHYGFITFEECCETWAKADITSAEDITCTFEKCGAYRSGTCKYAVEQLERERLLATLKEREVQK